MRQQLDDKEAWLARAIVSDLCRDLKHQLSEEQEATIYIPLGLGEMESFSLTRQAFNQMVEPVILETLDCCEQLVRSTGIDWEQIKQILLVGGSCRIPYVKQLIEGRLEHSAFLVDDPDLAVCFGAAIYGKPPIPVPSPSPPSPPEKSTSLSSSEAEIVSQIDEAFGVVNQAANQSSGMENGLNRQVEENEILRQINQLFG